MKVKGEARRFGDDISTDEIIPGKYLRRDEDVWADHVMEGVDPRFADDSEGVVIVAGENFGYGSSREQAPRAIKAAGVSGVVAESFARIFYRNAINVGLPIATASVAEDTDDGDRVSVDLSEGTVVVESEPGKTRHECEELPERLREVLEAGGLLSWRRKNG
ncbi:MAG: 3-isopropylmalate dehydratase [Halobacteria archaeon]|nr:3-isopropylmalate dehydratase [Halobacteria archaeon]